jgi:pimeloyl-ACP methyl ester carboxylesterase
MTWLDVALGPDTNDRASRVPWAPILRDVQVQGVTLRVAEQGAGRPLLLINGIGANLEMWRPAAECLPGRQLIMFDVPGTGASPAMLSYISMRRFAQLVDGLLDEVGLTSCDVLGYSWGGALAQEFAHRAPHRVRSLVLAATTCGLGGRMPVPWAAALMATPMRYYSRTYLRFIAPLVFGSAPHAAADSAHGDARFDRPPSMVGYATQLAAVWSWTSRPWLATLDMPTLVLSGARDPLVRPGNAQLLARGIPDARVHLVDGGHLFLLEQPALCCPLIEAFLDNARAAAE